MTIIITTHIVKVRRKSRSVHAAVIGMSMVSLKIWNAQWSSA